MHKTSSHANKQFNRHGLRLQASKGGKKNLSKFYSINVHSYEKEWDEVYRHGEAKLFFPLEYSNCEASSNFLSSAREKKWGLRSGAANEIKMFLENIITLQIFNPHYEHKFQQQTEFLSENFVRSFGKVFLFFSSSAFRRMKNYSFHHGWFYTHKS